MIPDHDTCSEVTVRHRVRFLFFTMSAFLIAVVTAIHGQVGTPIPSRFPGPEEPFEVASIKPNRSGAQQWDFDAPPGRVVGTNVLLRDVIRFAYNIYGGDWDLRIAAPEWIKTARFDIDAKTPGSVAQARAMSMLRHLLAERFGMTVHYETREHPVYALVVARPDRRLGPQLTPNPIDCGALGAAIKAAKEKGIPPPVSLDPDKPVCGNRSLPGRLTGGGLSMEQFALHLAAHAGRTVIDQTGFGGAGFDYDLRWQPDQTKPEGPSLFTAIGEQLGLKLVSRTGPIEVLVIDSIRQPTSN
jgi:uncharacterized protein (TIGR03435 family)